MMSALVSRTTRLQGDPNQLLAVALRPAHRNLLLATSYHSADRPGFFAFSFYAL